MGVREDFFSDELTDEQKAALHNAAREGAAAAFEASIREKYQIDERIMPSLVAAFEEGFYKGSMFAMDRASRIMESRLIKLFGGPDEQATSSQD